MKPSLYKVPGIELVVSRERQAQNYSQKALAQAVGTVSQSQISLLESGRLDAVSEENLKAILETLKIETSNVIQTLHPPREVIAACFGANCRGRTVEVLGTELVQYPLFFRLMVPVGLAVVEIRCPCCGVLLQTKCVNPECARTIMPGTHCLGCGTPYLGSNHDQLPARVDVAYQRLMNADIPNSNLLTAVEELVVKYDAQRKALLQRLPGVAMDADANVIVNYQPPHEFLAPAETSGVRTSLKLVS